MHGFCSIGEEGDGMNFGSGAVCGCAKVMTVCHSMHSVADNFFC